MKAKDLALLSSEYQFISAPGSICISIGGSSTQSYARRALNVFLDNDLVAPEDDQLELIARLALEAQQLFFAAALYDPDEVRLHRFFQAFVLFCAAPEPIFSLSTPGGSCCCLRDA